LWDAAADAATFKCIFNCNRQLQKLLHACKHVLVSQVGVAGRGCQHGQQQDALSAAGM
jgi:hypothetical protein